MKAATLPTPQVAILAAGFSSRLGRPKSLARVRDVSLLRRTVSMAASCAPRELIVVVARRNARLLAETRGFNVTLMANPRRADGLSSSVRRAIVHARYCPAVLLLPVDLANLQARDLDRMILRWRAARRRVIARRVGQTGGIPLILPRWLFGRALEVTGDIGLRELIARLPERHKVLLTMRSAELDVDTPLDLRAARRRARYTMGPWARARSTNR